MTRASEGASDEIAQVVGAGHSRLVEFAAIHGMALIGYELIGPNPKTPPLSPVSCTFVREGASGESVNPIGDGTATTNVREGTSGESANPVGDGHAKFVADACWSVGASAERLIPVGDGQFKLLMNVTVRLISNHGQ